MYECRFLQLRIIAIICKEKKYNLKNFVIKKYVKLVQNFEVIHNSYRTYYCPSHEASKKNINDIHTYFITFDFLFELLFYCTIPLMLLKENKKQNYRFLGKKYIYLDSETITK